MLRIPTVLTTKVVTRVLVIEDGSVSGLNHTVDVPSVTRQRFVLDMANACEMEHVNVSTTIAVKTARCAIQKSAAQVMERATSMGLVLVSMVGQDDR